MALSEHDQLTIREYLLGKLTEDELAKIEERLMVEDDLFEELEISKGELIEDYRAGELSQQEKKSFEQFLATPEGGQRYVFAAAMNCVGRKQHRSLLERLELWLRMPRWVMATAATAVVIVIVALVSVRIGPPPRKFEAVTLTNNTIRRAANQDPYQLVTVAPDVTDLRVTLTLPEPATPGTRYEVNLDNRISTVPVEVTGQDANSVSVVIPTAKIPPGIYALTIFEIKPDGTRQEIPGYYSFNRQ